MPQKPPPAPSFILRKAGLTVLYTFAYLFIYVKIRSAEVLGGFQRSFISLRYEYLISFDLVFFFLICCFNVRKFSMGFVSTAGTLNVNVKKEISSPAQHCSFEEAIKGTIDSFHC